MIAIYSDSQIIDLEWIPKLKFGQPMTIYHSFEQYRDSTHAIKIAFTAHRLHCTYDQDCQVWQNFEDKIIKLSESSQLVLSLESELHNYHWHMWDLCHRPNVYWLQPGLVNLSHMKSHVLYWGDFFKLNSGLYKKLPEKLAELRPYDAKPMCFDALLGSPKPHRQFVYDSVHRHQLAHQFVMTYGGAWSNDRFYAQDYFVWEPGCVPEQNIIGTADTVNYLGHSTPLSHVIPIDVFNQTAYSIVAETDHDNTLSFYSEKTAKVLIARRLFVAFSGYKFLHNLRELGFQTFGNIIDESYDDIEQDQQRYKAAFEQVRWLCAQPQAEILSRVKSITEHNYKVIMTTDWTQYACDRLQPLINSQVADV